MIHDVKTEQLGDRFRHECTVCGIVKESRKPSWDGICLGPQCKHLGTETKETVLCDGCKGSPGVHSVWICAIHGTCVPMVKKGRTTTPIVKKCHGCEDRDK